MKVLIPFLIGLLVVGCGPGSSIHEFMKQPNIHEAAAEGNIKRVKQHLVEGVDVNAKFKDGWTPLHMAAEGGHREIVDLLIAKGADINATAGAGDGVGWTPLHEAAEGGHKKVVELLILKGADINAKNGDGRTPLDLAIEHKNAEIADTLRKHGGKKSGELKAGKETPSKGDDKNSTTANPVKKLTLEEKVVGEYESIYNGKTYKRVFLKNGIVEWYVNGKKRAEYKLEIVNEEIHADFGSEYKDIYRINTDRSITHIAYISDGEREDFPKQEQLTYKKIEYHQPLGLPPSNGDDKNSTKAKPSKELTIKDVAGTYEARVKGGTAQMVFLENGKIEFYENGKINQEEARLKIAGNEIHFDSKSGDVRVFRIEPTGDLTYIAEIEHGKRHDHTKERQATFKKIK